METLEITADDVVMELERCIAEAAKEGGNNKIDYSVGLTAPEIAKNIGRNVKWVRKQLKRGLEKGTIVLDFSKRLTMLRRETTVPVYRPCQDSDGD